MDLRSQITIEAPAERVWEAIGERFMRIAEWAAPITSSCPVGSSELRVGVTRACSIAPFGPIKAGVVKERLTRFDRDGMTFEYEALEGMPSFVVRAVNRWSVERLGGQRSIVRIHATLTLRGVVSWLSWPMKWQLQAGGVRVAEELKYFVEHGRAHPRKQAASGAPVDWDSGRADQGGAGRPTRW
jgi:uncharacterized protein YndB with AHSA1/START domain